MWQNTDIHAAAKAIGEIVAGRAAGAIGQMPGTREELDEGSELRWVVHVDARAKHESVRVERNAAG